MRALIGLVCAFFFLAGGVKAASIVNSKHDMSSGSTTTGPKADTETEICIFCHVPHKPNPNVPLWNHAQTAETFTFYSSNRVNTYLGLTAPTMSDLPGSRTKLCLSCHDGVTALGGVYNLDGSPGTIAVTGSLGAGADLDTTLADDHPVLYGMDAAVAADAELQLPPGGDPVKTFGSGNKVECTSCHNPHDNQYGYFLVKSNANAAICVTCHLKSGYTASVHAGSSVAYTPPGGSATTVGEWSCRCCHTAHGAAGTGEYLLAGAEEAVCYQCHGTTPLTGALNIQTPFGLAYKHPVATSGVHLNPETDATNLGIGNRHSECQDCHQPHQAQSGNRLDKSAPDNLIVGVLLGGWGVEPTYGAGAWVVPASYTERTFADTSNYEEPWLCLKCHSSYAYGGTPPVGYTDQSIEFNINNVCFHPVLAAGNNPYCTPTATNGNNITMVSPWNQTANDHDVMMCSDCHGYDGAPAQGPHGSGAQAILQASLVADESLGKNMWATPLCVRCHKASVYVTSSTPETVGSRFSEHGSGKSSHMLGPTDAGAGGYGGCLACHGNIQASVKGTLHGNNYTWAQVQNMNGSFPAINFLNNATNMNGWEQRATGGYCWNNGACKANHEQTY